METNCPPQFLAIVVLAGLIFFLAPRSWVLPAFLIFSVFTGMTFQVYFLNLNFYSVRVFLLLAWLRILVRRENKGVQWLPMDKGLIAFACAMVLVETLRRGLPGLIYAVANSFYDTLGIYFLCRTLIRERKDVFQAVAWLGVVCAVLAGFMTAERLTRHNWLAPLGATTSWVTARDGKLRCQATFLHAVLAGTFGAVLLPLFVVSWTQGRRMKLLAVVGCIASTLITVSAGSSGPLMTYAAGVFGLLMWPLRGQMRRVRWILLIALTSLHLIMNAPVWALIARVSSITGGSGWHRFNILDTFINHIGDWWLVGTETTSDWGWLTEDVANQYCIVAKHGGLLAVVLFIRLLVIGFREVGIQRANASNDRPTEVLVWAFGCVLLSHLATFFATSYFDQTIVLWYLTLALIASLRLVTSAEVQEGLESFESTENAGAEVENYNEGSPLAGPA
jgi:hypothetical protein